jgi:hypothetical protein
MEENMVRFVLFFFDRMTVLFHSLITNAVRFDTPQVEEAEISGDLYLRSGIVESSRYALSLANQFYAETFNYARLAYVYRKLAHVVTSQVPIIDASNQLELSSQLGRFYKVYFHGGAPDDLLHSQVS